MSYYKKPKMDGSSLNVQPCLVVFHKHVEQQAIMVTVWVKSILQYAEGLKTEYPEARISQFVIYCIGNQGFRVFEVS